LEINIFILENTLDRRKQPSHWSSACMAEL